MLRQAALEKAQNNLEKKAVDKNIAPTGNRRRNLRLCNIILVDWLSLNNNIDPASSTDWSWR